MKLPVTLLVMVLLTAGCAGQASVPGAESSSPAPTPRTTSVAPVLETATAGSAVPDGALPDGWTRWKDGVPPAPPHATCGAVVLMGEPARAALASQRPAERCFARAATHCTSASVVVTYGGVDTGRQALLTIQPAKPCSVRVRSQDYTANFDGMTGPTTTSSCTVSSVGRQIVFGCDELAPIPVE